jgi:hypothetical protein
MSVTTTAKTRTLSRATLRRTLKQAGLPSAPSKYYADGFSITEYIEFWGVLPSIPGYGADTPDIKRALNDAGITFQPWFLGGNNVVMVPKIQTVQS